jgi:hypothetical protein
MEASQIEFIKAQIQAKYDADLETAESQMEIAMCKAEKDSNLKKLKEGINPFNIQKPDDSDFECIGCGS